jgi:Spy/CpxP family protein refolding chaperone
MKNLQIVVFILLSGIASFAQVDSATMQAKRDPKAMGKIQALRIAYISEKVNLTPEQAEKFWPIYHEFAEERSKLRKQLRDIQRSSSTSDPKADKNLIKNSFDIKQKELDLKKNYSDKFLKIISARQVISLRQAEQDFRTLMISRLQQRAEKYGYRNQFKRKR